jgi:hypothetical protein
MRAEADHAALVWLLEQFVCILSRFGDQSFVVLGGEILAVEERADDGGQGSYLCLTVRNFTLIDQETLLDELISNCREIASISSLHDCEVIS